MAESQLFDWSDYLKLAEELVKRPENSALRTAMSRAYYYIYHPARDRAILNGLNRAPRQITHKAVWDTFSNSPESADRELAQIGGRLKEKRERADYEDEYKRLSEDAPEVLALAKDFVTKLAAIPNRSSDISSTLLEEDSSGQ